MSELVAGDGSVLRTARRRWTCAGCGEVIAPGQRYLEQHAGARADIGRRHCLGCAHSTGLARHRDAIADALEHLPARLRRIVTGAPATLVVPETAGGPTGQELAIATAILRLLALIDTPHRDRS